MTTATCEECGHEWELTKPPDAYRDGPRCSECGGTDVSVAESDDGDGEEPVLKRQGRKDRLRSALGAVPGVGEAGVEYAARMWELTDASEGPEELYDVVSEIDGVSDQQARRVADAVFQIAPDRDPAPFDHTESDSRGAGGGDGLDAIIRAKEAGLLGDDGGASETIRIQRDDGTTVEVPADHPATEQFLGDDDGDDAVAEALSQLGSQISQSQQMLARALEDDDGGEDDRVERLEERIEELQSELTEKRRREEIARLEEKIEEMQSRGGADDPEVLKTDRQIDFREKQLETLNENIRDLPNEVADAVERTIPALKELGYGTGPGTGGHPMWSPPTEGQVRGRPQYQPDTPGGGPREDRDRKRPRPKPAGDRTNGRRERRRADGKQPEEGTDAPDGHEGVTEEDAEEIRAKIGLDGGERP